MDEKQLQNVERQLGEADAKTAAAVAFAAIIRIGELGREAGDAFAEIAKGASDDADISDNWDEGCAQISEIIEQAT